MTAAAATTAIARNEQPTASLRQSLTAFIDVVLDNLASIVAGSDDVVADAVPSSAPSRAAIAGHPDPRITRSLSFPGHHS